MNSEKTSMFQKLSITLYIVFFVFHLISEAQAQNRSAILKEDFIGTWKGEGKIIVAWCEQKQLSFDLQLDMDGNVSGKIGDALIRYGKLKLNNRVYRWLRNKKYIIDAKLLNNLIEKENIKRESIRIFLDFRNSLLTGGFHTSGSKFGGKEKMILSGSSVKLVKVQKIHNE